MSQVQVSRWIMSDRLDRDRPASIQLTTMKTKLIDFILFTEYVRMVEAYKSTKIHNDKGQQIESSYDLPCGS
jgi:hypothetical protein